MSSSALLRHQTLAVLPLACIKFAIGFAFGWTAPTIKLLENTNSTLPLTMHEASWIASLHEFGRFVSPLLIIPLLGVIGRKTILTTSALISFAIWFGVLFTRSVPILYFIRFVFGVGLGMYDILSCIYLEENCVMEFRKMFYSALTISFYLGLLIEFVISSYLPYGATAVTNLVVGLLVLISTVLLIEPVHFLLDKDKITDAQRNFMQLRGEKDWDVINFEFDIIKRNVAEAKGVKDTFTNLITKENFGSIILAVFLNVVLVGIGHGAVIAYAVFIFPSSDTFSSNVFAIFFAMIELLSVCVSWGFIKDRFNPQLILQVTLYVTCVVHICTTLLFYKNIDTATSAWYPWWILMSVGCFTLCNAILEPTIRLITTELIPSSRKATGDCLIMMFQSAIGFLTIKLFLTVMVNFGHHVAFTIFMCVSLVGILTTYIVFPMTCLGDFI